MLAKELKIKTIKRQRICIEELLCKYISFQDGDPSIRYVGYIYPENVKYFENEGFVVTLLKSENALIETGGKPLYYISVRDDLTLTEEETKEAEEFEVPVEKEWEENGCEMPRVLGAIMGG